MQRLLRAGVRRGEPGLRGGRESLAGAGEAREAGKLRLSLRRREEGVSALSSAFDRTDPPSAAPLVWFHAPSVGEGLQAKAVLEALTALRPDLRTLFTWFSPSADRLGSTSGATVAAPLPWDLPEVMGPLLDRLRPSLLVFTKTEVWPTLARDAATRGIPVVLVAATLPEGAGRMGWAGRRWLAPVFRGLDRIAAISGEDAGRFREGLGVPEARIGVTGDPGIDSAVSRTSSVDPAAPWFAPIAAAGTRPVVVAGSTWEPDERVLVPALARTREAFPDLLALIAPHEPTGPHLHALRSRLAAAGMASVLLSEVQAAGRVREDWGAVLVDRVGILAPLYRAGQVAFVGGGFHRYGLHSVVEPAAAGLPVLFGSRYRSSHAAIGLCAEGGARAIAGADELADHLGRLLRDREPGGRARAWIERHRGAAERTATMLWGFLPPPAGGLTK